MNRMDAMFELARMDGVSQPGEETIVKDIQTVAVKTHAVAAGIIPGVLGYISKNEFKVVPRKNAVAGTIAAVRNTMDARWFNEGNPLNIVPKAVTLLTEGPDGVAQDLLHLGGSDNGYVITTAA